MYPVLFGLAVVVALALTLRRTVFSRQRQRRMYWRTRCYLPVSPGFASVYEVAFRWSRMAAVHHGRLARPSMPWARRVFSPASQYAVRLGRTTFGRKVYARFREQMLILGPPGSCKTGFLGDEVIIQPGPALVAESRDDLYQATAGYRAQLGPVHVFNPLGVGDIPSTFRWNIVAGCEDPDEALLRAEGLVGAVATGEMQWWAEAATAVLAAVMHLVAMLGGDMADVWAWAADQMPTLVADARTVPGISRELLGSLSQLERGGKTADSIKLTLSKSISWMASPAVRAMVTGPDAGPFDVEKFCAANGTIYMISGGTTSPSAPCSGASPVTCSGKGSSPARGCRIAS